VLRLADPRFGPEALDALARVLRSGTLTQGPAVAELEAALAAFTGARHAVATTSATACRAPVNAASAASSSATAGPCVSVPDRKIGRASCRERV